MNGRNSRCCFAGNCAGLQFRIAQIEVVAALGALLLAIPPKKSVSQRCVDTLVLFCFELEVVLDAKRSVSANVKLRGPAGIRKSNKAKRRQVCAKSEVLCRSEFQ